MADSASTLRSISLALSRLPAPVIYLVSVVATRSVALITLPLMAAYLTPADYGNYDVAVSFVEFVNLLLGLATGVTLIRFASTAHDEAARRQCARELIGTALAIVLIFGVPTVIVSPYLLDHLGIATDHTAFRVLVAGITLAGIIELPLFWLRLQDRALTYFAVVMTRALAQALLIWLVLWLGYGVAGIMYTNGAAMIGVALVLLVMQIRDTGIAISRRALTQIAVYGLPIVGADLAMFGLGNANKLFMPDYVAPEVIAHFGLAARLALLISLATAPFDLWWGPRRIRTLSEPGGLELGARMWALATAITIFAATGILLGGPLLVHLILPATYQGTIDYVIPMVVIQSMHLITLFTNVGSYARQHGSYVLTIEAISSAVAILGYMVLIPQHGVVGVIVAMAAAQCMRLALHL